MYDILELNDKLVNEIKEIARLMEIPNYDELRKQELIYKILDQQALNPTASNAIRESLVSKFSNDSTKMELQEVPMKEEKNHESDLSSKPKRKRVSPGEDSEMKKTPVVLEPSVKIPASRPASAPQYNAPVQVQFVIVLELVSEHEMEALAPVDWPEFLRSALIRQEFF